MSSSSSSSSSSNNAPASSASWEKAKVSEVLNRAQTEINRALPTRGGLSRFVDWYHRTYFKAGKVQPLIHIMLFTGTVGYLIERPHLKHELEHAKHAETE